MAKKIVECISIDARDLNVGRVVEKTEPRELTPTLCVSVPDNYYADIYIDGVLEKSIKPCVKKNIKKIVGADKVSKKVSILYVNRRPLNDMSWGIGNLPMYYKSFGDACIKVGANGFFLAEITDAGAFYDSFEKESGNVDLTECASKISSGFRDIASEILLEVFKEAVQPIFDTEFLIDEVSKRLNDRICGEEFQSIPGIVFKRISVAGIRT